NQSAIFKKYQEVIDPQSAFEILTEKLKAQEEEQAEAKQQVEEQKPARTARAEKSTFEQVINSPITKQIGKEVVRGVFGMLFGTTPRRSTTRRKW
ncbi:MAG: helicase HerA-like domain-containing protein, partial [Cyclobacteriaceae bacterium]